MAETGSTNSDAMALARNGAPEGIVLVADHQTGGRGRRGRVWVAPPEASLLVTVLLRPPARVVGLTAMAVGVAMAEAVEQVTGHRAGLKWPNDLVVADDRGAAVDGADDRLRPADRKLAGILAEADWPPGTTASGGWREPSPDDRLAVVVGLGINVNWPDELPDDLAEIATALNHLTGHDVDRVDLLVAFLERLAPGYERLVQDRSAAALLDEWRRRSATLGRRVRVDLGSHDVEGTAVDLTDEGHLVVETLEGERRSFAVGDVVHLRPL
ncbi:MAG TPA: biotin--[acetyl-CoA-carboxylase] ligase [Acidimicrobiales bacterium]|nr:biotin--[acetyl-CoA-carboxylase] ligase [Acidimicrobiales bacterium]